MKKDIVNYKNFYVDGKEKIIASFEVKSNKILCKINAVNNPEEETSDVSLDEIKEDETQANEQEDTEATNS